MHHPHGSRRAARRSVLALAALSALGAASASALAAESAYPDHAIRVVVPFPAGAGADYNARLVTQKLANLLKVPVIVDNRPGANGIIGTDNVAKSAPDGYTVLFVDRGALGINPSLYKSLAYDPARDFSYVGIAAWGPYVLVASPRQTARTLADFVAQARKNPGKLNYASFGNGSMTQLGTESLDALLGIQLTHVPYKGGSPALTAAMSSEVDVALVTIGPAIGAIRDGRVKPLLVGGSKRSPLLPQVPAVAEVGGDDNTIPNTFFGFALPAATPAAIRDKLAADIRQVLAMPDVANAMRENGFEPGKASPEEMTALVNRDIVEFGKQTRKLGIQPE